MFVPMLEFVKQQLEKNGGEVSPFGVFRKRSEHIKRVFMWAERLADEITSINREALMVAAIFHDVGYGAMVETERHAEYSAKICEEYLYNHGFNPNFIEFVTFLVRNHSRKELLMQEDTPIELIVLMEADLLDETGALSIVWDCMSKGSQKEQKFEKTYEHIKKYSARILERNPMVTSPAKRFWEDKQKLVKEFMGHLACDLGIEDER